MSCKILDHVTISHHFTKRKPWVKRCEIYQHRGSLTAEEPRPENDPNIPLRLAFLIAFLMVFRGAYMPGYVVCSIPFFWSGTKPCLSTYSASFAIRENSSFCSCGSGSKWGAQSLAGLRLNMY